MPSTRTVTLDLHVHTNYSHDGRDSVEAVVKSAIALRLDGIAICDHNTLGGSVAARSYAAENQLELVIIPGIEISTSRGHLLVLGLDEPLEQGLPLEETIERARQQERETNGTVAIIAPHPYHPFRHSLGRRCLTPGMDAIEVFNARYFTGLANAWAKWTAAHHGITAVAGSDAHSADCVGLATVEVEVSAAAKLAPALIVKRLKEGAVRIARCQRAPRGMYYAQLCRKRGR
jgi:predicted metal-dependent phosphoesterase TrpH